jgi:hypothetical protein
VVGISRSFGGENSKAKWWGYRGQVVGKIPRPSGGDIEVKWWGKFQGQVVGISRSSGGENSKAKWWGYRGQVVGKIIKVKWWGYLGQVVGISRSSSGDIKVRGRGLEVKVKKKWWGVRALSNSLYYRVLVFLSCFVCILCCVRLFIKKQFLVLRV